ncbi:hypothetical protein BGX38DRAFT_1138686 [Terfezia claveryi]|nr:hypothetical protein BGX38DRAFT_1138686 [Terfezia claveryi]
MATQMTPAIHAWTDTLKKTTFSTALDSTSFLQRAMAVDERLRAALQLGQPCPFPRNFQIAALKACDGAQFLQHMETYLGYLEKDDWYGAVLAVVRLQLPELQKIEKYDDNIIERDDDAAMRLHEYWNGEFQGRSLQALNQMLQENEKQWIISPHTYYTKSLVMFQSSGTGKSRLASEIGNIEFEFSFVFRKEGDTGYPSGDAEITAYFASLSTSEDELDARVGGLFGAMGVIASQWYKSQLILNPNAAAKDLAYLWNRLLAPVPGNHSRPESSRSPFRGSTYQRLQHDALSITEEIKKVHKGKIHPNDIEGSTALYRLIIEPMKNLIMMIQERPMGSEARDDHCVLLLIAFDEAANIPQAALASIRRLLRSFTGQPLWALFLSTYNSIPKLQSARKDDPSARIRSKEFLRHEPFLGLQLDLELNRRFGDHVMCQQEILKPLIEFSKPDHLTLFGRPLWRLHAGSSMETLRSFVEMKLLGGPVAFDTLNQNHVFSILASRLCLDPCVNSQESVNLATEAVNSHLRLVVGMNQEASSFRTITPSEPIVAHTAASLLMGGGDFRHSVDTRSIWPRCLDTLSSVIGRGLVEKGLKGELYARILVIIARDILLSTAQPFKPNACNWSRPFAVMDFLGILLNPASQQSVFDFQPMSRRLQNIGAQSNAPSQSFRDIFSTARMNLNHFTSTGTSLLRENVPELLHELLRQSAGLQLAFNQPAWDILVPLYFGQEEMPFDRNFVSALAIQVKNTGRKNKLNIGRSQLGYFQGLRQPILVVLMDLGVPPAPPQSFYPRAASGEQPSCWGIHLQGSGSATWGFLDNLRLGVACKELLGAISMGRTDDSVHSILCSMNDRFQKHTRVERFLGTSYDSVMEDV